MKSIGSGWISQYEPIMQQKILYLDFDAPTGHVGFNQIWLNALAETGQFEITLCVPEAYGKRLRVPPGVKEVPIPGSFLDNLTGRWRRLLSIFRFLWVRRHLALKEYDTILIASFDSIAFYIAALFLREECCLVCHNNIQKARERKLTGFCFRRLGRKHRFIVLEEYMRTFLVNDFHCPEVTVIHHGFPPPFDAHRAERACPEWLQTLRHTHKGIIFVPSMSSCSPAFREFLLHDREFRSFLQEHHLAVVIRTPEAQDNTPEVIWLHRRLESDEYAAVFLASDLILLPYSNQFSCRVSAVLLEAFANRKKLLLPAIPAFEIYRSHLSESCYFTDYATLSEKITELLQTEVPYLSEFNTESQIPDFSCFEPEKTV